MAYESVLSALADPTRRRVFEELVQTPRTVGELASGLPVSRPAVSQHLKVLETAGLVRVVPVGNRRMYYALEDGLAELTEFLEGLRERASSQYTQAKKSPEGEKPPARRKRKRRG